MLSRQAIKRGLFPRVLMGDGPTEASDDYQLDSDWAMVWTRESLGRAIAKLEAIPPHFTEA